MSDTECITKTESNEHTSKAITASSKNESAIEKVSKSGMYNNNDFTHPCDEHTIIPKNYFPPTGWKNGHVYKVYEDEINDLPEDERGIFTTMKREQMKMHYSNLKTMAKETIHHLLTVEILKLYITSPNGNIGTVTDFTNFSMKTALKNTDE
eukprot:14603442-Ditylum_brightwellii.AAC.1